LRLTNFGLYNPQAEIRMPQSLALSLFVFRVCADHAHHAFAVDDLAVVAHLLD
jgi:hypothetical protein